MTWACRSRRARPRAKGSSGARGATGVSLVASSCLTGLCVAWASTNDGVVPAKLAHRPGVGANGSRGCNGGGQDGVPTHHVVCKGFGPADAAGVHGASRRGCGKGIMPRAWICSAETDPMRLRFCFRPLCGGANGSSLGNGAGGVLHAPPASERMSADGARNAETASVFPPPTTDGGRGSVPPSTPSSVRRACLALLELLSSQSPCVTKRIASLIRFFAARMKDHSSARCTSSQKASKLNDSTCS
mmetsp:Transcript_107754/g.303599  ORF Transcript_107754/g.303599 Transcript_107754/m.303599 type:complete len:245 (+) Transcript_107754:246-980(+)